MTTQIDWQRELDASFGSGDDVPVGHYVAAGQQAVRRRRAVLSAAGVAAALVVGLTWTLAPGSAPRTTDVPVANDPSGTRSPQPDTTAVDPARSQLPWRDRDAPVRVLPGGDRPEVRDGAVVHAVRNDLYPGKGTDSAAYDVTFEGTRWWVVLEWDTGGGAMMSSPAEDDPHDTFDEFVAAAVEQGGMTSGPPDGDVAPWSDIVTFRDGKVTLRRGAVELERVDDPLDVAGISDSVGLAVELEGEEHWFLVTQGDDDSGGSSHTVAADSGWATFDQWLADQVALQTGSPGVRIVRLAADGTVSATAPSVEVIAQQADPDLPMYGTDEASSAVALVEWQGSRWFVLAVGHPGEVSVTTVAASKAPGVETLDDFVAFLGDRGDEGGMR